VGAIPLGGFVSIPGMHRPIPHDAERRFGQAVEEAPTLAGPVDRVKRALDRDDLEGGEYALDDLEDALRTVTLSSSAHASVDKGLSELRDALGPDAYWKAPTWKRLVAIGAGPAANILLTVVVFTALFMTVAGEATRTVATVAPEIEAGVQSPADAIGLRAGDRIVAIDGEPVAADEIADTISASAGQELTLTVVREGEEVQLGPIAPVLVDDRYRLGFGLEGKGLGFVPAVGQAIEVTGLVAKEIVKSLGRLVTGDGRDEVSSPIGITQASSDAVERGAESYLWVLGLISLSLALLNLLPLLPLDGGHILFTLIEGARGKFLRREIYERVSMVGLAVVLLLFFVGLSNDIGKLS
jgi:regulator of sigma E protease